MIYSSMWKKKDLLDTWKILLNKHPHMYITIKFSPTWTILINHFFHVERRANIPLAAL